MAESPARLNVTSHKDIAVVEFTENKILDEMSVSEIERALTTLLESKERPKILLDFANVDHLTSAERLRERVDRDVALGEVCLDRAVHERQDVDLPATIARS